MKHKTQERKGFLILKVVQFQVRQDSPRVLFFKTTFDESEFQRLNLSRRSRRNLFPESLSQVHEGARPISTKKYNYLQKLLPWIPKVFHDYYKNLAHNGEDND